MAQTETIPELAEIASKPLQPFVEEAVLVAPEEPISRIIGTLESKGLYEALVKVDRGIELVTLRKILRAHGLTQRKVSTLTIKPPALTVEDTVGKAASIMSEMRIRTLPVTGQDKRLVGQVSARRLLEEVSNQAPGNLKVMDIMTPNPVTVDSSSSLDKARELMVERDIDHLPVTEDGGLVGMITSQDLVSSLLPAERASRGSMLPERMRRGASEVGGIMREEPITCNPADLALQVLRFMLDKRKTAALATLVGEIQGIITLRDYLNLFTLQPTPPVTPVYIVNLPDDPFEASVAETKFKKAIDALRRVYPAMTEARATIKTSSPTGERRRFEVDVQVRMPGDRFGFTEQGWSLADAFDRISTKLKRLMTKPKKKPSYRRFPTRSERSSSAP